MATLEQIAREAGVSRGTVANVLKGRNKESWAGTAQRAEEIRAIAKRMGYRPNAAAVATAKGKFGALGVILGQESNPGFTPQYLLEGICLEAEAQGASLSVAYWHHEDENTAHPQVIRQLMVDGLLFNGTNADLVSESRDLALACPFVSINVHSPHNCVFPDDEDAVFRGTNELLRLGHTRITFVTRNEAQQDHYSVRDRRQGYDRAMQGARLASDVVMVSFDYWQMHLDESLLRLACDVLQRPLRPTALVFSGAEPMALTFFTAALQLGWQVPRDLSLLGVANSDQFPLLHGHLLSILQVPFFETGRAAVRALRERIASPGRALPSVAVPYGALSGNTLAPPTSFTPTPSR